ncbi:hypothetical protein [Nocardia panacis]|uniref:hypothetical protein n=1 Tax=Nocardia panacis TaxID=2340916 RepID=UPI001EF160E8|nr:hypothetical protein [Nocardia panacis]
MGDPAVVLPTLFHLMWSGLLTADLNTTVRSAGVREIWERLLDHHHAAVAHTAVNAYIVDRRAPAATPHPIPWVLVTTDIRSCGIAPDWGERPLADAA